MKKIAFIAIVVSVFAVVSCGTARKAPSPAPTDVTKAETLEGNSANSADWSQFGFAMNKGYKNGAMVDIPYVYFTGVGQSQQLRIAEEMARQAAYSLISDTFGLNNLNEKTAHAQSGITDQLSDDSASRISAATEEFNRYVAQVSANTIKGFSPFGETKLQFDDQTRIYTVWARVGMPAKSWDKIYKSLLDYKPKDLTSKELDGFMKIQKEALGDLFGYGSDEQ